VKHLKQAEPSADLREALLNTDYITSLIKLENTPPSVDIWNLLVAFLSFLKGSVGYISTYARLLQHSHLFLYSQKFTETEELYLHHRNIYDGVIHKRVADIPLNAELVCYLVLIAMLPHFRGKILHFTWTDPLNVQDGILQIHSTLRFNPMQDFSMTLAYGQLLEESLSHPVHAGSMSLTANDTLLLPVFFWIILSSHL
jgi:hypothetical protein